MANGTAALHLICAAAGLAAGDEVIVPSMTFVATVDAVAYTGSDAGVRRHRRATTEPWLDPSRSPRRSAPRTKAIMAMAYGGHPGEMPALAALARRARASCCSRTPPMRLGRGSAWAPPGHVRAAGAFSFFSNKNLAVGEGGMVVTDDDEVAARMRLLRSHGMTTLTWDRHRGHASGYDVVDAGLQLPHRRAAGRAGPPAARAPRRRERPARRARRALSRAARRRRRADRRARPGPGARLAHHLFTVVLEEGVDRDAFRQALADRGIQTSVHYPPVHRFSIYARRAPTCRVTDAYGARASRCRCSRTMTDEQQDAVVDAIHAALDVRALAR